MKGMGSKEQYHTEGRCSMAISKKRRARKDIKMDEYEGQPL
jgi:hypothetical protein